MRVCTDRCFGQDLVIPTSNDFVNAAGVRNQSNRAHDNTLRLRWGLRKTAFLCNICNQNFSLCRMWLGCFNVKIVKRVIHNFHPVPIIF